MKFLHLCWLRWQLHCMRDRHVELIARAMEHWHCEAYLSAKEHYQRAYHLESEICQLRRRIRRVEMVEC